MIRRVFCRNVLSLSGLGTLESPRCVEAESDLAPRLGTQAKNKIAVNLRKDDTVVGGFYPKIAALLIGCGLRFLVNSHRNLFPPSPVIPV